MDSIGTLMTRAFSCTCPKCHQGKLYQSGFDLRLKDRCDVCGLHLAGNDSADGPAVFLIFVLGFLLVPAAVVLDMLVSPPLWVHVVLWGVLALVLTVLCLKPLKALVLLIQYQTRPETWK